MPHVAARRIVSRAEAQAFLEQAVRLAGVTKVLLIGGDVPEADRPVRRRRGAAARGFPRRLRHAQVGLPGYPEGPPAHCDAATLDDALARNWSWPRRRASAPYVVTQFSFAPNRIVEYCADLARRAPDVPVYVGLPGPTSPRRAAALCAALRRQRLAARAAGAGHGRGAPVHQRRPHRPADRAGAPHPHRHAPATSSACTSTASAACRAPPHWMNARITARSG